MAKVMQSRCLRCSECYLAKQPFLNCVLPHQDTMAEKLNKKIKGT